MTETSKLNMMGSGTSVLRRVMVNLFTLMEITTKESGSRVNAMAMGSTKTRMVLDMKASGKTTFNRETE